MASSSFYKSFDKKTFNTSVFVTIVGALIVLVNLAAYMPLPEWITRHNTFRFGTTLFLIGAVLTLGGILGIRKSFRTPYCASCKIPAEIGHADCETQYEGAFVQMTEIGELKNITGLKVIGSSHTPRLEITVEYCPACVACALVSIDKIEKEQTISVMKERLIIGPVVRTLKDTLLL